MAHIQHKPFRPRAEVSLPRVRQFSEYNGKEASSKTGKYKVNIIAKQLYVMFAKLGSVACSG